MKIEWKDISAEKVRTYTFPSGAQVVILEPEKLFVAPSGSHRIITKSGAAHYVASGFIHIEWDGPVLF